MNTWPILILGGMALMAWIVPWWQWKRNVALQGGDDAPERLEAAPDLAAVYIVREPRVLAAAVIFRVSLDDAVLGGIASGNYYAETVTPGEHVICVESMSHALSIECQYLPLATTAGSTHFVKIGLSFSGMPRPEIVDAAEGQRLASRCTMLVAAHDEDLYDRASRDDRPAAVRKQLRPRPPLSPAQRHLEIWRGKPDDELLRAAASLDDYTDEASAVIRAELAWRNLTAEGEIANEVAAGSFCDHCGADMPVGVQACAACGKTL